MGTETEEYYGILDQLLMVTGYGKPSVGLGVNFGKKNGKISTANIYTFHSANPFCHPHSVSGEQPVEDLFKKISNQEAIDYFLEKSEEENENILEGGFAGAIAARRQYSFKKIGEILGDRPNPLTLTNDPKTRIKDSENLRPNTGVFIVKGTYYELGFNGSFPIDEVRYETVKFDPCPFKEKTVEKMITEMHPEGFGNIEKSIGDASLGPYNVYEIPEKGIELIDDYKTIRVSAD